MIRSLALWMLFLMPCAYAQGKADAGPVQRYGGVLATDCSNHLQPQLLYPGDSLVVRDGGKPVLTGRNVKPAPGYFGPTPPPGFETALTSEVSGGDALVFVFYRDASGLHASVEGGPKTMAALPASLKGKRVKHCDPNRNMAVGAATPTLVGPTELLKDPAFRKAYLDALGPLAKERWLARMDGPAPPLKKVRIAGTDYDQASPCKNHDCAGNTLLLLYAAPTKTVYGKVVRNGRSTLIGSPPPAVATELEKLWKAEFRAVR